MTTITIFRLLSTYTFSVFILLGSITSITWTDDTFAVKISPTATKTLPLRVFTNKKPTITSISPLKCSRPGKTVLLIRGRNFGASSKKIIAIRSGRSTLTLKVYSWRSTYIKAKVPRSRTLKAGRTYYIGISVNSRVRRWLSNTNKGFRVCASSTNTDRITTAPNGSPASAEPSGNVASVNPRAPSASGAGLGAAIPEATAAPEANTQVAKIHYRPRQVLLASPNIQHANKIYSALTKQGYKIKSRKIYKHIGLVLSTFRTPDGVPAADAVKTLRAKYKKASVDVNTLYIHHSGPSKTSKYIKTIKWGKIPSNCGHGRKIGLLDSSVDQQHNVFKSRKIVQKNFVPAGSPAAPKLHGTAISSLWVGNPSGTDIGGVVPGATVYAAGVFLRQGRKQTTTSSLLIQGLDWLVSKRVDVINLSFGGPRNKILATTLRKIMRKNISVVASAGNGGPKGASVYPAAQRGVVAVTALTSSNKIYSRATRGNYIDFAAPGVNIWVAKPGNGKKVVSGTSYAAPYVSAALLVLKTKPGMRSHSKRLKWLKRKARKLGPARTYGRGLLQVPGACGGV